MSATGNDAAQAIEDRYGEYGLEPSIIGAVSASGLSATQALEDQYATDNDTRRSGLYATRQ
jgi:hypothetical protein